jgi:hypothetical protein
MKFRSAAQSKNAFLRIEPIKNKFLVGEKSMLLDLQAPDFFQRTREASSGQQRQALTSITDTNPAYMRFVTKK